jgi:hypothetical protein
METGIARLTLLHGPTSSLERQGCKTIAISISTLYLFILYRSYLLRLKKKNFFLKKNLFKFIEKYHKLPKKKITHFNFLIVVDLH